MRMPTSLPTLGPLETRLMDELWQSSPATVREVADRLDSDLAYTTLMTTLDRLFKKGLLTRTKLAAAFVYAPALSRSEYQQHIVERSMAPFLQESPGPVMAAFVNAAALIDEANLARLELLIAERRGRGRG